MVIYGNDFVSHLDEKSQCHARLVHKLLSQYIESETSWVEKYPTSRHVPKVCRNTGTAYSSY